MVAGWIGTYRERGYIGPVRAFEADRIGALWDRIATIPIRGGSAPEARNRHLDHPCVAEACRSDRIGAVVRAVLGPNVLLWRTNLFAMGRSQPMGIRWHQDSYRTLLSPAAAGWHCSVQLAFTPASDRNCLQVIPGSHRWSDADLRASGYAEVPGCAGSPNGTPNWGLPDGVKTAAIRLAPGEFCVFHPLLLHASLAGTRLTARDAPRATRRRFAVGWWIRALPDLIAPPPDRCSLAMRLCRPEVRVALRAYGDPHHRPVLASGRNEPAINAIASWPGGDQR